MRALLLLLLALPAGWLRADEVLRVGFGLNKPPYIFEGLQRGIEYEIVAAAVTEAGWKLTPIYAPQERLHLMLAKGEIDAITTTNERSGVEAFYSQPYIHYHNSVGVLARRHLSISQISDLADFSVSAYQRARYLLGPEFQAMAERNPRYREEAQQLGRNRLLYSGRIDAVVAERHIFEYLNREVADQVDTRQPVDWFDIFAPTPYQVGFVRREARDRFDVALARIQARGEDQQIRARYIHEPGMIGESCCPAR